MIIHYDINNKMQADRWTKNGKTDPEKTDKFCPYSIVQVASLFPILFWLVKTHDCGYIYEYQVISMEVKDYEIFKRHYWHNL